MSGDAMKKVQPGDKLKLPAETFNTFIDTARAFRADQQNFGTEPRPELRDRDVVLIKNQSGADRQRFDVLGVADVLITPTDNPDEFQNCSPLTGVVPTIAEHIQRFVVLLEPVVDGTIARAVLAGVVPVRLKVIFDWHHFAHIENEEPSRLVSDCVGYPILWRDDEENEDENGNRWALVQIGGHSPALGIWKNNGALVDAHEHFRITGSDTSNLPALAGTRPTNCFGPDYAVNGSQSVNSGQHGVYQRDEESFIAYGGAAPEPGDQLGPVPGSGTAMKSRPPVCRVLGIADAEHGIAQAVACRPAQRFKLLEPLYECGSADAQIMGRSGYNYIMLTDFAADSVGDTLGAVAQSPLAIRDSQSGKLYIPAGKCLNARYAHSPGDFWEALDFGECTCGGASSSSQSSFSSGSSGSGSSSASDSGSQSGSQSESGSGPSGSGSGGSGGSGGDVSSSGSQASGSQSDSGSGQSGSGGSGGSGSDKSTAIVPASWSPTGYTALFITECPEVRFDDVMAMTVPQRNTCIRIDQRFLEVCEPGTVLVCGCVPDIPVLVGATVQDGGVCLRFAEERPEQSVRLGIRLTGIRKGFRHHRFPNRTHKQFEANERFIRSVYPDEQ